MQFLKNIRFVFMVGLLFLFSYYFLAVAFFLIIHNNRFILINRHFFSTLIKLNILSTVRHVTDIWLTTIIFVVVLVTWFLLIIYNRRLRFLLILLGLFIKLFFLFEIVCFMYFLNDLFVFVLYLKNFSLKLHKLFIDICHLPLFFIWLLFGL